MAETPAAAPTPAKPAKKKHVSAYVAKITIRVPLDMMDPDSYPNAITAIGKIKDALPAGSTVETVSTAFGKMEAAGS